MFYNIRLLPASIGMRVVEYVLAGDPGAEDAVDPDLVEDNDRHEYECYHCHDPEGVDAGGRIVDRQVRGRVEAGRNQVGEEAGHAGEADEYDRQTGEDEGLVQFAAGGEDLDHQQ